MKPAMRDAGMLNGFQNEQRRKMLDSKGMRFPLDVILMCIRWYVAYPLSYRHVEEMMGERGVNVDHSSINRWAIRFLSLLESQAAHTGRLGGIVVERNRVGAAVPVTDALDQAIGAACLRVGEARERLQGDLSALDDDLAKRAHEIRERLLKWTGIPCGVGIGSTKTRAKLANHIAKTAERSQV